MEWKKIIKGLLFPHPILLGLFAFLSLALLIYCPFFYESADVISIISYVCSFYALVFVCLRIPAIVRFVKRFRQENKYAVRYATDVQWRINLSLRGSFLFNAVYAAFQLGLGLWHHSVWFYSMAGYYLLLGLMRLMLVKYTRGHTPGQQLETEWKKYRLCGVLLLMMTFVLTIFILYFVLRIREFKHHEFTTISMAAYTFASLTLAIINAFRYKKYGSPAYSAAKAISLVSAIVSVLTLENAMLTAFGQNNSELFRQIMLGATGAAVVCAVQGIAIYLICNARKNLKAIYNS